MYGEYRVDMQGNKIFEGEYFTSEILNETVSIPQLSWGNNRCKWR